MVNRSDPDKPTIERARLHSTEILAALVLTIVAAIAALSLPGREARVNTAAQPVDVEAAPRRQ